MHADFPATPVIEGGEQALPDNIAELFGPADAGAQTGGPCLFEPAPGVLFPGNWLRPRFRFGRPGHDVYELRVSAPNQKNELVVYTRAGEWIMPKAMWGALAEHSADRPISMAIRSASLAGGALAGEPQLGSTGSFQIAPVVATGSIVYWTITASNGELKGFKVGEESVTPVLRPDQVQATQSQGGGCIGCHTSTPDGQFVGLTTFGFGNGALASIESATVGQSPPFWSPSSMQVLLNQEVYTPSFSKAHWRDGDYTMIATSGAFGAYGIGWFDLQATTAAEGTAFGMLARAGDARNAMMPSFSHDGQRVAYVSSQFVDNGFQSTPDADIMIVPYNDRRGGTAAPLQGAADPSLLEYYPSFSPDDRLIAFTRAPSDGVGTYNNPSAEVYVVPSAGGTPTRIAGNDPVACIGDTGFGLTNSWPKWAPTVERNGGRDFYWLTFSSLRRTRPDNLEPAAQLYIAAVVEQDGMIQTFPALYLWNQPELESNHTPAWDTFDIPDVVPN